MHYHLIEPIISKVTLMEVEKAIWLLYDNHPACFITDRLFDTALSYFLFFSIFKYYCLPLWIIRVQVNIKISFFLMTGDFPSQVCFTHGYIRRYSFIKN